MKTTDYQTLADAIDDVLGFIPSFKRDRLKAAIARVLRCREEPAEDEHER